VWSECTRLIANAIIYYNTYLLSQLLEKYTREGDDIKVEVVRNVSPIAWLNINLDGIYKFRNVDLDIDWKKYVQKC
jgi:hypothetical protein